MSESELKYLPIKDLLAHADRIINLYVSASVDAKTKKLADQRQADLFILHKVICEKRANEKPLI